MAITPYPGVIICTVTYDQPTLPDPITLYSPGAGLCVTMDTDGTCTRPDTDCGKSVNVSVTCNNNADTREATIRLFNIGLEYPDYYGTYRCDYQQHYDTTDLSNLPCKCSLLLYMFLLVIKQGVEKCSYRFRNTFVLFMLHCKYIAEL